MNKLQKYIMAGIFFSQVSVVNAEDVSVPNTFTPATPAKASEVNANFQALVSSLQGVKKAKLEQNGSVIGQSLMVNALKFGDTVLTNVIKLNSGYAIAPYADIGMGQIAVAPQKDDFTYFSSANCTGTRYTGSKFKDDPVFGTKGYVVAFGGTAAYITSPVVRINDLVINSVRGADGVCTSFSEYLPYPGTGSGYCDNAYTAVPGIRIKEITYDSGYWVAPGQPYYDYNLNQQVTNGAEWYWNSYGTEVACQLLGAAATYYSDHDDGTGTHNTVWGSVIVPALDIGKAKVGTGTLREAIPFLLNNPTVTGVTTAACVDTRGRPSVCLPNSALKD